MSSRSRAQGQRTEAVPAEGPAASSALRRGIPRNSGRARGVPKPPRENSRNTQSREMTPRTPSCPREGDVGASGKKKPCRPKPRWRKPRSPPAARTKRPRLPELRLGTGSAPRRAAARRQASPSGAPPGPQEPRRFSRPPERGVPWLGSQRRSPPASRSLFPSESESWEPFGAGDPRVGNQGRRKREARTTECYGFRETPRSFTSAEPKVYTNVA